MITKTDVLAASVVALLATAFDERVFGLVFVWLSMVSWVIVSRMPR